jgi:anti-sigma factor RsiW
MKPIDPAEISALLDGELPAERAEQVRRAIAEDEALRLEYEEIVALDTDLKACAQAAVFHPRVSLDVEPATRIPLIALVVGCLLLRLVVKTAPSLGATGLEVATGLEIGALLFFVGWTLRCLLAASEHEARLLQE